MQQPGPKPAPRPSAPLVRSRLIVESAPYLRARGADVDALMTKVGIPPIAEGQKHVTLPVDVLRAYFEAAARALEDPLLGVHLAEAAQRGTFGVVEFACRSAPNVREALLRVARYDKLLNGAIQMTFEETADGAILRHRLPREPLCVGRVGNEYTVALIVFEVRRGTRTTDVVRGVHLAHGAPEEAAVVADVLGTTNIRYDAGENALELSRSVLELPIATADAALLTYLEEHAERAIAEEATGPTFRATLQRLIRDSLAGPSGGPDLAKIARGLAMSARTLQRRLADEGTSFQDLVDDARRELAIAEVRGSDRAIGDIAVSLGYADVRPFLRAFKRWTGKTPSQYRDAAD
jgi:AraC-like DNA-binding protein